MRGNSHFTSWEDYISEAVTAALATTATISLAAVAFAVDQRGVERELLAEQLQVLRQAQGNLTVAAVKRNQKVCAACKTKRWLRPMK